MKISIVTLSFNQAGYLREAIDSVLQQAYPELEYIVVDPGSTDGSRALIESYGERIAHVLFEPDRGAADGLNKGFAQATGEIYGFLNADDLLYPGALQQVAAFFRCNPDCGIVFGSGYKIDGQGHRLRHFRAGNFSVERYLYGGAVWLQQATFFRAAAFHRSPRFNIGNRTCWDGELFVHMANQGARIGYIREDLGGFRIHDASISGTGRMNDQYRCDCRRIFSDIRGRQWSGIDDVRRFFYRATGQVSKLATRWMN
ncbi:MAG TPA: glycosyltransferase family 2 protein [Terracidiphilus sp.]|nr:glycosyltransferase family 2 protein [Terracidiphilus sp.]